MKTKPKSKNDVAGMMVLIQEQLAVMNQKLDSFMTKSLTELAQALAAAKPVARQPVVSPGSARSSQHESSPRRPMYAIVCFECGKDTELPFKPSGNRPVYCPECFAARKGRTPPAPVSAGKSSAPSMSSPVIQPAVVTSASQEKKSKRSAPVKTVKSKRALAQKTAAKKKPAVKKKPAAKKKK